MTHTSYIGPVRVYRTRPQGGITGIVTDVTQVRPVLSVADIGVSYYAEARVGRIQGALLYEVEAARYGTENWTRVYLDRYYHSAVGPLAAGVWQFRARVHGARGATGWSETAYWAGPPLAIAGDLPDGAVGDAGTYQYAITGVTVPVTVAVTAGSLPPGAAMDDAGLVTYGYTTAGEYSWTVTVTGADGKTASVEDGATVVEAGACMNIDLTNTRFYGDYSGPSEEYVTAGTSVMPTRFDIDGTGDIGYYAVFQTYALPDPETVNFTVQWQYPGTYIYNINFNFTADTMEYRDGIPDTYWPPLATMWIELTFSGGTGGFLNTRNVRRMNGAAPQSGSMQSYYMDGFYQRAAPFPDVSGGAPIQMRVSTLVWGVETFVMLLRFYVDGELVEAFSAMRNDVTAADLPGRNIYVHGTTNSGTTAHSMADLKYCVADDSDLDITDTTGISSTGTYQYVYFSVGPDDKLVMAVTDCDNGDADLDLQSADGATTYGSDYGSYYSGSMELAVFRDYNRPLPDGDYRVRIDAYEAYTDLTLRIVKVR